MHSKRWPGFLRLAVSISLLLGVFLMLDTSKIVSRLVQMQSIWVATALLVSSIQISASAWRWKFTASRLGIDLPFKKGLGEYYLATFLNQVLPGGILGDVSRAWRHAYKSVPQEATARVVHAVIIERASGQVVMIAVATVSFLSLPIGSGLAQRLVALILVVCLGLVVGAVVVRGWPASKISVVQSLWYDTKIALLSRTAFSVQVATSLLVVGSYIGTFILAARSVGVDLPVVTLVSLVAPVLVTMLIPVTVAGWGVRESAAAVLWALVGRSAVDGVSISAAYGLLTLLASIPGCLMLFIGLSPKLVRGAHADRGRTGHPGQDGSGDTVGAMPGPTTRSDPT